METRTPRRNEKRGQARRRSQTLCPEIRRKPGGEEHETGSAGVASTPNLYQVEDAKLAFALVDDKDEVEGCVASIDDSPPLVPAVLRAKESIQVWDVEEVAETRRTRAYERKYLVDERPRRLLERRVELGQTGLARGID